MSEFAQTSPDSPGEVQLELLAPWYQKSGESRTLDFFDAIPKYPFSVTTSIAKAERIQVLFILHGKRYLAEIVPAQSRARRHRGGLALVATTRISRSKRLPI